MTWNVKHYITMSLEYFPFPRMCSDVCAYVLYSGDVPRCIHTLHWRTVCVLRLRWKLVCIGGENPVIVSES